MYSIQYYLKRLFLIPFPTANLYNMHYNEAISQRRPRVRMIN